MTTRLNTFKYVQTCVTIKTGIIATEKEENESVNKDESAKILDSGKPQPGSNSTKLFW